MTDTPSIPIPRELVLRLASTLRNAYASAESRQAYQAAREYKKASDDLLAAMHGTHSAAPEAVHWTSAQARRLDLASRAPSEPAMWFRVLVPEPEAQPGAVPDVFTHAMRQYLFQWRFAWADALIEAMDLPAVLVQPMEELSLEEQAYEASVRG